jgi:hypothetical protein
VLTFSSLGYASKDITITDQTNYNVTLTSDNKLLNEVVVTALGVKKETRRIGYSTQTVSGDQLTTARDPNPVNGLIGKVAGLSVGATSEILGVPNFTTGPGTPNGQRIALRFQYPESERTANTANYNAALQSQFGGNDDINGKMWLLK